METIVIKQEKSKKGIAVAIPIVVAAIHALIRGAYKMSLFNCFAGFCIEYSDYCFHC